MVAKEKTVPYKQLHYRLWSVALGLVLVLAATTLTFISPTHVAAANSKKPICAILDQGRVDCPSDNKYMDKGGCWYKDLGSPEEGPNKDGWVQAASCENGIFQAALKPAITPSEDPALTKCNGPNSCDLVKKYLDPLINVLAAAVGVVVTISIVIGGIQYASSAGDPGKTSAAKQRITNAIIALIGFFLLYAVLSWLMPGGLLHG